MSTQTRKFPVRKLTVTAMLGAVATVLMFISFNVPLMPSFIKLDLSELPALIASFTFGPLWGVCVCAIKNLVNVFFSTTGGVGELSNFLLGVAYVVPAGLIYQKIKTRKGALIAALIGCAVSALYSLPHNYYLIYPLYGKMMPMEAILGMYQALNPNCDNLFEALLTFNVPFTFVKEAITAAMAFVIYKPLSPVLHGRKK